MAGHISEVHPFNHGLPLLASITPSDRTSSSSSSSRSVRLPPPPGGRLPPLPLPKQSKLTKRIEALIEILKRKGAKLDVKMKALTSRRPYLADLLNIDGYKFTSRASLKDMRPALEKVLESFKNQKSTLAATPENASEIQHLDEVIPIYERELAEYNCLMGSIEKTSKEMEKVENRMLGAELYVTLSLSLLTAEEERLAGIEQ